MQHWFHIFLVLTVGMFLVTTPFLEGGLEDNHTTDEEDGDKGKEDNEEDEKDNEEEKEKEDKDKEKDKNDDEDEQDDDEDTVLFDDEYLGMG